VTDDLAIDAVGVVKTYGDVRAADGIDLSVRRGEVVAVLGPNGAGKTTFTEMCAGYRRRDPGPLPALGVDPSSGGAAWRADLGIVLQQARDLADLSVLEVVRHFASYYPAPRPVDEVIDAVGLAEKRDARAGVLSGGQRRRLDVALGIVGRPELLFLDEPTTGFDPEARREFWTLIENLKAEGTTILLTTHYLEEAERLADRVAVITTGRVLACDTPEALGGRQQGQAHVVWAEGGELRRETTTTPTRFVAELSARFGGEVPELSVLRPTLEDVYLRLIGDTEAKD
jgi:ABC-2 type transport system ATP-binding protein